MNQPQQNKFQTKKSSSKNYIIKKSKIDLESTEQLILKKNYQKYKKRS